MIDYEKFLIDIESIQEGSADAFRGRVKHLGRTFDDLLMTQPSFYSLLRGSFLWGGDGEGYVYWSRIAVSLVRGITTTTTKAALKTRYQEVVF